MLADEGFALNLSTLVLGWMACGTVDGRIYIFEPKDNNVCDLVQRDKYIN